jgi:hypothetical protein
LERQRVPCGHIFEFARLSEPSLLCLKVPNDVQICMGTFILTFVGRSISVWLENHPRFVAWIEGPNVRRRILVIGYFITIALIISVFGVMTIPYVRASAHPGDAC